MNKIQQVEKEQAAYSCTDDFRMVVIALEFFLYIMSTFVNKINFSSNSSGVYLDITSSSKNVFNTVAPIFNDMVWESLFMSISPSKPVRHFDVTML